MLLFILDGEEGKSDLQTGMIMALFQRVILSDETTGE